MSKSEWGKVTWILFHSIIENIKDDAPNNFIKMVFNNLKLICNNLPCPYCKEHAISYLNNYKKYNFDTKDKLKFFFFTFHNNVNKRLNKQIMKKEILEKYKTVNLNNILINFSNVYLKKYTTKMLIYNFHRRIALNKFFTFLKSNKQYFNGL
jgi:thiol-disulfide isomerase/thioredoxin